MDRIDPVDIFENRDNKKLGEFYEKMDRQKTDENSKGNSYIKPNKYLT